MLYEADGYPLATPKALTPEELRTEASGYYEQWIHKSEYNLKRAENSIADNELKHAAFDLHQPVEALYHCTLLTLTLYSPKPHRLTFLRSQAEGLDESLRTVWPEDDKFAKRCFAKLQRAYVEARYSAEYDIGFDERMWLKPRIEHLTETVKLICGKQTGTG